MAVAYAGCVAAFADTYTIAPSESVFAVVTHKAGIASALAHDHFVYPETYTTELSADPAHPDQAHFKLQFATTALVNDDPTAKEKWYPHVKAAGILDAPFKKVCERDRKTIREHMLDESQLDAEHYPTISAELKGIREQGSTHGDNTYAYEATVALTVHGKTVEHAFAANIKPNGDTVRVEAVGSFNFTDFGIAPYSAFLGAVRNQDTFDVYVNAQAKREDTGGKAQPPKP
jgi:polyisoprenoid-binding protein YceI